METPRSDILGRGYGSSHAWRRGGPSRALGGDKYLCEDRGAAFVHEPSFELNCFESARRAGVPDLCPGLLRAHVAAIPAAEIAGRLAPAGPLLPWNIPGMADWATEQAGLKTPMPEPVLALLASYAAGLPTDLSWTTFRHIVAYFATGARHYRLGVACADFGYRLEELAALRAAGKTARDIVAEIVAREPSK